jgi:hypothetical protein
MCKGTCRITDDCNSSGTVQLFDFPFYNLDCENIGRVLFNVPVGRFRIILKLVDLLSLSTGDWLIQCYVPLHGWWV